MPTGSRPEQNPAGYPAVEAFLQRTPPNLLLISIAAIAAALAGIAWEVIGHAVAARVVGSDWFTSSIFGEVNTPTRIAGVEYLEFLAGHRTTRHSTYPAENNHCSVSVR